MAPAKRAEDGRAGPGRFGALLRAYRLAACRSQDELADRANLSKRAISDLERGERRAPYPTTVRRLAEALDLTEEERTALISAGRERPGNLPAEVASFVGRGRELIDLQRMLGEVRLLTLTGPGGVGKTRLALRLSARSRDDYADGVWLADLAPLRDPKLLPHTVSAALGRPEEPGRPVLESIEAFLRHRSVLLLLDNCEHVLPASANLVARLLQSCPRLTVMATSREALHVLGERVWLVPPLRLPEPSETADLEDLARHEAIQLFAERAAAVSREFVLGPGNAEAVVDICRCLDGMPLAIELAAARTSVLTVEEISARLDDRFHLLTGAPGGAGQHTLRGVCEWSHELLSGPEQVLFRHLAVFAGGWTLEGAEAVCADGPADRPAVLQLLTRLVDRSMVQVKQGGGQTRYRLLETLRQFALAKLRDRDEEGEFRDRQLAWCVQLAERVEAGVRGPRVNQGLDQLAAEHDNLRAALAWGSGRPTTLEVSLRLAGALAWYWWVREHSWEGIRWLKELLALADADNTEPSGGLASARVRALTALGYLHVRRSDFATARPLLARSLAGARVLADAPLQASALLYLGQVELGDGHLDRARGYLEEGLRLSAEGPRAPRAYQFLSWLGQVASAMGRLEDAEALHERQLQLAREHDDPFFQAVALSHLGRGAIRRGDPTLARAYLEESLLTMAAIASGDVPGVLSTFAELAVLEGRFARAVRVWTAAEALLASRGAALATSSRRRIEQQVETARRALSADVAAAAWADGQAMSVDQAVAYALSDDGAIAPADA